jgi:hypothetical protein
MRTLITGLAMAALSAAGLVAGTTATATAAAEPTPTPYALSAFGIGTAVKGGSVPATSGKTAYRIIGCTNRAGVDRENHEAEATVPGLGVVSGVKTRVWTTKTDGVVASNSLHQVASIMIGEGSGQGTVEIRGVKSYSRAYHDDKGFHAAYETEIGQIVYTPVEGGPEVLLPPTPGQTLEVPGLANIKLGSHSRHHGADGAKAYATTLKIEVIPSDTMARVAHTSAKIGGGVKSALFRGNSNATRMDALDGNLTSGPTPHLPMPCQGTDGEVKSNNLATVDLGGQVVVSGANTSEMADQTQRKAWGWEKSSVAELNLGGGQLVISGVVGKVNVSREDGTVTRDIKGTTVGSITANGEPQEIPDPGQSLTIPGVAVIETAVVKELKSGLAVTAVKVTLLDGTGAVINLGQAQLQVFRSGL